MPELTINIDEYVCETTDLADLIQETLDHAGLNVKAVTVGKIKYNYIPSAISLPTKYSKLSSLKKKAIREEYIKLQDGKCMHCGGDLDSDPPEHIKHTYIDWKLFPPGFLNSPVHLQHCHKSDMTEGAVHAMCNAVLWQHYGR